MSFAGVCRPGTCAPPDATVSVHRRRRIRDVGAGGADAGTERALPTRLHAGEEARTVEDRAQVGAHRPAREAVAAVARLDVAVGRAERLAVALLAGMRQRS